MAQELAEVEQLEVKRITQDPLAHILSGKVLLIFILLREKPTSTLERSGIKYATAVRHYWGSGQWHPRAL